ncbi:MAG: DUF4185 domain-containing protein [Myxococcales bacterium]|nr:DUF4185 domain-containing protein [Myxococcales bacterium]
MPARSSTPRLAALTLALVAAAALACAPAAEVTVIAARDLGPLEQSAAIRGRDGGYSVAAWGRTIWTYGDTVLAFAGEDGSSWRNNTMSHTGDLDAHDGLRGFAETVDSLGAPLEFLPRTADEAAYNAAHDQANPACADPCGAREMLWPGAMVDDPERARVLVFYGKFHGEPGEWNFSQIGASIAVWDALYATPRRPELVPGSAEPTLLFPVDEGWPSFGSAALAVDGELFAYGCEGSLKKHCHLGKVALGDALDRDRWRFFDGDGWSASIADARPVLDAHTMLSVHFNSHVGRYLAIYSGPLEDTLYLRTAPAPEGPWSEELVAAETLAGVGDAANYSGMAHPELAREGGRYELLSYYRTTGEWQGEIRLIELELGPP